MVLFYICVETSGLILSSLNKQQLLLVVIPLKYENCLGSKVWTNICFAKIFHQPIEQELTQSLEENPEKKAVFLPKYHCKWLFKWLALKLFNKFYIFIFTSGGIFQILHTNKIDGVVNHLLLNTKGIKQRLIWLMTACSCRIDSLSLKWFGSSLKPMGWIKNKNLSFCRNWWVISRPYNLLLLQDPCKKSEINVWSDLACHFLYTQSYIKQWK